MSDRAELPEAPRPRGKLQSLVRRLLYPDEHERERLLRNVLLDLEQTKSELELATLLLEACEQAFAPRSAQLYLRRSQRFRLLHSLGAPAEPLLPLLPAFERVAGGWGAARAAGDLDELPAAERAGLEQPGVSWVVAGSENRQWPNVLLLLGERVAGDYAPAQLELLQALVDAAAGHFRRHLDGWLVERKAEIPGRWLLECPECGRCHDPDTYLCRDDDAELEPTLLLERRVADRYLLERRLGGGAMGAVFAARDLLHARQVAIKILATGDAVAFGRFANEAKAGRTLRHPNLVEVLDTGTLGKHSAYMVMEHVAGRTLRQVLDGKPCPPRRVARFFDQILAAVAFAHEHHIVHRDLKPENAMVLDAPGDQVKVLDFGLAKLLRRESGPQVALTTAGTVIGTLSYMSPEQLAGDPIDHRTDLFAVGVMVSEALTGRLPFRGDNLGQMLHAVAHTPYALETRSPAQEAVAAVLGRALAKKPEERYADAGTLRRDLARALDRCEPFGPISEK